MPMAVLEQLSVERPLLVCDVIQKIVKNTPNWGKSPEPDFECVLLESGGFTLEPNDPAQPPVKSTAAEEHPLVRTLDTMIAGPPPPLKFPGVQYPDFTLDGLSRQEIKEGPPRRSTSAAPQPAQPTRTCLFWKQGKVCKHGANCRFAHFDIAPKTCKFWSAGMHCKHGAKCRFSHG